MTHSFPTRLSSELIAKPRERRRSQLRRRVSGTGGGGGGAMSAKGPTGAIASVGSGPSGLRNQVMLGAVLQAQYSISKWIGGPVGTWRSETGRPISWRDRRGDRKSTRLNSSH